jgi:hypothetical protein
MAAAWLTDPPNRFSPRQSWIDFLKQSEMHPGKDDPDVKHEVAIVQGIWTRQTERRRPRRRRPSRKP